MAIFEPGAAIRELKKQLAAAAGIGALAAGGGCTDEPFQSCPLVEGPVGDIAPRGAMYVCYEPSGAPIGSTSNATVDTGTTASGSTGSSGGATDSGSSTGTSGGTTIATTGESTTTSATDTTGTGETTGTGGTGDLCAALAGGPPDMPGSSWSGPVVDEGQCCFWIDLDAGTGDDGADSVCGRPFVVGGRTRVAPSAARTDWLRPLRPSLERIDATTRRALAFAWLADASAEHASVASFARFALQLMAVAAPPQLLVETHRAMADEIEHARLCYALASAYAGRPLGPGPLSPHGAVARHVDLADVAASAVVEGCLGETFAALQARLASARAVDPVVRRVLDRIAADEARHAALAWRFVAWAVRRGDARVAHAVRRAFDTELAATRAQGRLDLSRHGRLSDLELAELHRRMRADLVHPMASVMLHGARPPFDLRARTNRSC